MPRSDFALLRDNPDLVYLDNAATTHKPHCVVEAQSGFYTCANANVHRGLYRLGAEATHLYESAREVVARFIGAAEPRSIVFTRGTTEAINLAVQALCGTILTEGDAVLLSEAEHHSNLVPWQIAARRYGFTLVFLPMGSDGTICLDALDSIWNERIRAVSLAHVTNAFGTCTDVASVARYAHQRGALMLVDAAQSIGHLPLSVDELGCDLLAFSGHKVYGPTGIGVLYGRTELLEMLPPPFGGGEMIRSVSLTDSTWNEIPWKFEPGTPPVAQAIGLASALDYVTAIGRERIAAYEGTVGSSLVHGLLERPWIRVIAPVQHASPIVSFVVEGVHPHDVAQLLDSRTVAVRAGHHCAQPAMKKLGLAATVRASCAGYTTHHDVLALLDALHHVRRFFSHV